MNETIRKTGRPTPDLIGKVVGNLTVTSKIGTIKKDFLWLCHCTCGNQTTASTADINRKHKKSCGCLAKYEFGESNLNYLFSAYKRGAKNRKLDFNLTKIEFKNLIFSNCAYCGSKPLQKYFKPNTNGQILYNGIDRINNNIGYIMSNCVACCGKCNFAKSDLTMKEFKEHIIKIYRFLCSDETI